MYREQLEEMERRKNIRHKVSCDFNKQNSGDRIGESQVGLCKSLTFGAYFHRQQGMIKGFEWVSHGTAR